MQLCVHLHCVMGIYCMNEQTRIRADSDQSTGFRVDQT